MVEGCRSALVRAIIELAKSKFKQKPGLIRRIGKREVIGEKSLGALKQGDVYGPPQKMSYKPLHETALDDHVLGTFQKANSGSSAYDKPFRKLMEAENDITRACWELAKFHTDIQSTSSSL